MADTPLGRLARLLGGVVLMQGRLGHQILGQLLVYDTDEAAVAGATLVIAATARQRNALAQAAIRTAAPAIAVNGLLRRDLKRLEAREALLADRLRRIEERDLAIAARERDFDAGRTSLTGARLLLAPRAVRASAERIAELETENGALHDQLNALLGSPPESPPSGGSPAGPVPSAPPRDGAALRPAKPVAARPARGRRGRPATTARAKKARKKPRKKPRNTR